MAAGGATDVTDALCITGATSSGIARTAATPRIRGALFTTFRTGRVTLQLETADAGGRELTVVVMAPPVTGTLAAVGITDRLPAPLSPEATARLLPQLHIYYPHRKFQEPRHNQ